MKIVIVDDSDLLRCRIIELIKDLQGVEVVGEAKNGIEAVKIIEEKKPDFILLDLNMPELNGFGVMKMLKDNNNKTKICIFTHYSYPQYKEKSFEAGADYFFDKGQDFQEIKNLISQLSEQLNNGCKV